MTGNLASLCSLIALLICASAVLSSPVASHKDASPYKYEIKNFTVQLDHFSYANNRTFQIRYLINDTFEHDRNSPILFYTGNEGDIELFAANTGFMWEIAPTLGALVVFAEHRYYGQSLPFGNASFQSPDHLGYLSSSQALADYAALLEHLNPLAEAAGGSGWQRKRPVVAVGGSYGGMLAAWMRMKYPHAVTAGALAASAPILQFTGLTPCSVYSQIVTSVFTVSYKAACADNVRRSWDVLSKLASTADGRTALNAQFRFCPTSTLNTTDDAHAFADYLNDVYSILAMTNYPYANQFLAPLPAYPVREFCSRFSGTSLNDTQLMAGLHEALSVYANWTGTERCLDTGSAYDASMGAAQWDFQSCTEMVMPMCSGMEPGRRDMFPRHEWNLEKESARCFAKFGVRPQPVAAVGKYGGPNLEAASNIIFSNGLLDPWSGGGVLRSPNDRVQIVIIPDGAHHLDLRAANKADPNSVLVARQTELQTIQRWIREYGSGRH